jgi:hypothetical protein
MIVTVLRGLVTPISVMMIVTTRLVVTVLSLLVAVLVLAVLRANRQWNQSGERERRHCKNNRLPKLLTHGGWSLCRMAGASMNARMGHTVPGISNPLSVVTYGGPGVLAMP